jgi:hypothetical protein
MQPVPMINYQNYISLNDQNLFVNPDQPAIIESGIPEPAHDLLPDLHETDKPSLPQSHLSSIQTP